MIAVIDSFPVFLISRSQNHNAFRTPLLDLACARHPNTSPQFFTHSTSYHYQMHQIQSPFLTYKCIKATTPAYVRIHPCFSTTSYPPVQHLISTHTISYMHQVLQSSVLHLLSPCTLELSPTIHQDCTLCTNRSRFQISAEIYSNDRFSLYFKFLFISFAILLLLYNLHVC